MKNICMLTSANLRKSKSQTISLLVFVLIAATLLNIGLVLLFGMGNFFEKRAEQNHSAHFTAVYPSSFSIDEHLRYIESDPRVAEIETQRAIGGFGDYYISETGTMASLYFTACAKSQKMDAPVLMGEHNPLFGDAIYIPSFMFLGGGFEIGDDFFAELSGKELRFCVAGCAEEFMMGAQMTNIYRFYVSDEKYDELCREFPESGFTFISARFHSAEDAVFFQADYKRDISIDGLECDLSIESAKQSRTMVPMIAAIVMTAFAGILLAVCMIVIRFRILNSIEENLANIGAQKATGHKSAQIIAAILAQFSGIAALGGLVGIAFAQGIAPLIANILKPIVALDWNPGFDPAAAAISFLAVLSAVSLIAFVSAWRIGKLHPLAALRGGIATHSFKKNSFPLDETRGNLNLLLALKQLFQNKKQAISICVIVAAVSMASAMGIAVNYNMNEGRDGFARALFGEMSDAWFMMKSGEDGEAFSKRLLERPEVRKSFGYDTAVTLLVDEISILAVTVEDCSLLEGNMLLEGRYPKHENEIALGTVISKTTGKKSGDTVAVKCGENEKNYIVCGIVQYINNGGFNGFVTGGGVREVKPDYKFAGYNAYVREGIDLKEFLERVQAEEGDIFDSVMNAQDQLKTTMDSMSGIFAMVAAGIMATTAFVVILTLYMVIKTTILHKKRELGIQKAVGYTTFLLMNQIALNITPIIAAGAILGALAGYFGLNPIMAALMGGMGIVKVSLPAPIDQTIMVCFALIALAYFASMLIAWRIRRISAHSLVSE